MSEIEDFTIANSYFVIFSVWGEFLSGLSNDQAMLQWCQVYFVFLENNIALIKIDHLLMLNLHYSKFKFVLTVQLPYIFLNTHSMPKIYYIKLQMVARWVGSSQGDYNGRGQQTASPMLTAIMSGGVGISGRELSTQLINSLEQANHSFS